MSWKEYTPENKLTFLTIFDIIINKIKEYQRNGGTIKIIYLPIKYETEIIKANNFIHSCNVVDGSNYRIYGYPVTFIYGLDEIRINDDENNTLEYLYYISNPVTSIQTIQTGNLYINNLNNYQNNLVI